MQYEVPILFIIFNRLRTTKEVFNVIREIKPQRLYIAADGPRTLKEKPQCDEARSIIKMVDWECDLHILLRDENLGCKYGPYSSISWFFEHENEGVILEDDCLPDLTFFPYIEEMLQRFRTDERVAMISGHNEIMQAYETSYIFSRFYSCWGWATWKRSWKNMDIELLNYNYVETVIPLMTYNPKKQIHWQIAIKDNTTWDWQWCCSLAAQNQLCIMPSKNLVANIGFGNDGTHCLGEASKETITITPMSFPLIHPKSVMPNWYYDQIYENKNINIGIIEESQQIPKKKKNILISIAKEIRRGFRRLKKKKY